MNRNINLLVIAAVFSGMLYTGCKKYDEGPSFTLRTAKSRITNEWTLVKTIYNGKEEPMDPDVSSSLEIKKDGSYTSKFTEAGVTETSNGKWEFSDDKEKIIFIEDSYKDTVNISKLTSKEFWLKYEYSSGNYSEIRYDAK